MKLLCDCGWEGKIWEAAITFMWDIVAIACPACGETVRIKSVTESRLVFSQMDEDGSERVIDPENSNEAA